MTQTTALDLASLTPKGQALPQHRLCVEDCGDGAGEESWEPEVNQQQTDQLSPKGLCEHSLGGEDLVPAALRIIPDQTSSAASL